jgi:type IV pilus assembly protein PilO
MNIKGDYHNLALFFDQVARLSRIVNIQDIQISRPKAKKGDSGRDLITKCMAVTYKFIEDSGQPQKSKKKKKRRKKRG